MEQDISLHPFGMRSPSPFADALVVLLCEPGEARQAALFASVWQPNVPSVDFVGIEFAPAHRHDTAVLRQMLFDAARARSIWPSRLILFGAGQAGALALELVFQRAIWSVGVVGLNVPLDALSSAQTTSSRIRLVQRATGGETRLQGALKALRRSLVDVRAMTLPEDADLASDVAIRACGTFIIELVACAGHLNAP